MKIALYAGTYVKDKDGAVRSIYQLVSSFRRQGHEVVVWSPDVGSGGHDGVAVHAMPSVPIPLYPDYRLGFFNARTARQLRDFLPDIIHISTPDIIGKSFLLHGRKLGVPVVSAYHTDFPSYLKYYHLGLLEPFFWKYLAWFYNSCDLVLAPNDTMRKKLAAFGIGNVGIWSRGIDRQLFHPGRRSPSLRSLWGMDGKRIVVYAGRFVWYKDVRMVMDLYDRFMRGGYGGKVGFVMIGSGPEEAVVRQRMPEAVFPGYLAGEALPEAYASGDVFLFPSTTEAFCNVTLEGIACGLPAVVSDVGGCAEIVRRSGCGIVAKAGDLDGFFSACLSLVQDDEGYGRFRALGLAYAERQSWNEVNNAVIEQYAAMTGKDAVGGCAVAKNL